VNGAGRFGVGFLIGVILVSAVTTRLAGDEATTTTEPQTSLGTTPTTIEPWFEPGEVMIGATALLPGSLDVKDGIVTFHYDLVGLAPTLVENETAPGLAMPAGDVLEFPEIWQLTTESGKTVGSSTGPRDSSVRFEMPSPDDEVASITLTGWRVLIHIGDSVSVPLENGASGELRRGTVTVSAVLEQSISTVVHIDFEGAEDPWQVRVDLRPLDPHWNVSSRQAGMQLTWNGTDPPPTIVLEDAGYDLVPVSGSLLVYDAAATP